MVQKINPLLPIPGGCDWFDAYKYGYNTGSTDLSVECRF